jgi:hypothetical protein
MTISGKKAHTFDLTRFLCKISHKIRRQEIIVVNIIAKKKFVQNLSSVEPGLYGLSNRKIWTYNMDYQSQNMDQNMDYSQKYGLS